MALHGATCKPDNLRVPVSSEMKLSCVTKQSECGEYISIMLHMMARLNKISICFMICVVVCEPWMSCMGVNGTVLMRFMQLM